MANWTLDVHFTFPFFRYIPTEQLSFGASSLSLNVTITLPLTSPSHLVWSIISMTRQQPLHLYFEIFRHIIYSEVETRFFTITATRLFITLALTVDLNDISTRSPWITHLLASLVVLHLRGQSLTLGFRRSSLVLLCYSIHYSHTFLLPSCTWTKPHHFKAQILFSQTYRASQITLSTRYCFSSEGF